MKRLLASPVPKILVGFYRKCFSILCQFNQGPRRSRIVGADYREPRSRLGILPGGICRHVFGVPHHILLYQHPGVQLRDRQSPADEGLSSGTLQVTLNNVIAP